MKKRKKTEAEKLAQTNKDPSPEEIDAACVALQETWSDREKLARKLWCNDGKRMQRPCVESELTVIIPVVRFG